MFLFLPELSISHISLTVSCLRAPGTHHEWPNQSPDLNPIEHMWEELERRLKGVRASNADQKFAQLEAAWKSIPMTVVQTLLDLMPRRCQAVIDAKGYPTKNKVYCRYFDCHRREIPDVFQSHVFPESTVYCGRRIGAKYISISKRVDDIPEPPVKIRNRVTLIPQHYFTVCLATIYGPEPKFVQIVDFIEYHKLQGATFFHIYLRNASAYDRMLLDDYVKSGEIELIVLNDRYWRADFMWHNMQINDCHMRNINFAKWTTLIDIDERLEIKNELRVVDYLDSIDNPNVVNLHFNIQWVLKYQSSPAKFESDEQFESNLVFNQYHNTSRVGGIWRQPKCIIRPDKIGAMTIHTPLTVYHGFIRTFVNSTIGVVRHYRNVDGGVLINNNNNAFTMGPYQLTSIDQETGRRLTEACLSRVKQVYDTVQYSCEEMEKVYLRHNFDHPCIKDPGYLGSKNQTNP
uniref:Glycosyltransferase family 92 protein n=2 Tax=Caenorhabditis japonica TaxID=281687 RepID=A0A8R1HQB1_CAEJA